MPRERLRCARFERVPGTCGARRHLQAHLLCHRETARKRLKLRGACRAGAFTRTRRVTLGGRLLQSRFDLRGDRTE